MTAHLNDEIRRLKDDLKILNIKDQEIFELNQEINRLKLRPQPEVTDHSELRKLAETNRELQSTIHQIRAISDERLTQLKTYEQQIAQANNKHTELLHENQAKDHALSKLKSELGFMKSSQMEDSRTHTGESVSNFNRSLLEIHETFRRQVHQLQDQIAEKDRELD